MEQSMNSRGQSIPSTFNSTVNKAKRSVTEASSEVSDRVSAWASQLQDASSEYIQTGRRYVVENPVQSAGIAAAVGAVIGCIAALALSRE